MNKILSFEEQKKKQEALYKKGKDITLEIRPILDEINKDMELFKKQQILQDFRSEEAAKKIYVD